MMSKAAAFIVLAIFALFPMIFSKGLWSGSSPRGFCRPRTLATIHDGGTYAEELSGIVADVFADMGGEVVFQGAVSVGDTDMSAILTEIAATSPDVVFFPVFPPESEFIAAQLVKIPGLENSIMVTGDSSLVASFPTNTGEAAVGIYISGPSVSGEGV